MPPHATFNVPSSPSLYFSNKHYSPASGSAIPHILLVLCMIVAFASPPFPGRSSLFCSAIVVLAICTHRDPHFTNEPGIAQMFSQLWANWFAVLEKLFSAARGVSRKRILGPESLFWRIDSPAREAEGFAPFGWAKFCWAVALIVNLRGVGWNHQVKNVPTLSLQERKGKAQFLASRVFKLTYVFFMADLTNHMWMQLFFVAKDGDSYSAVGNVNSKFLTVRDPDLLWRFVKTVSWGPLPYYSITFQYNLLSILAVASNLSRPEDWPPLFGSISKVTTVRIFWGQFWHQLIRRSFNTFTGAFVDALGIRRGTNLSSHVQIWLAFLLTSFFHAQLNLITVVPSNISFSERTMGIFQFFMWQAAAISFEDLVKCAWEMVRGQEINNSGSGGVRRFAVQVLGWFWVMLSFWISIPWAADLTLRFRFGDEVMLPFSVVGPWVERAFDLVRTY